MSAEVLDTAALRAQLQPQQHYRVGPARCACGFDAYNISAIMVDYRDEFDAHLRWASRQPTYRALSRETALALLDTIDRLRGQR